MRLIDADAYMFPGDLEQEPTVEAEPVRHGHWFFVEYDFYSCSVCGESYYNGCQSAKEARERLGKEGHDLYKYCPHCGAKMDEEVDR